MTAASAMRPTIGDLRALLDAYGEACGHARASDRLEEIASALAHGRVGTLMVAADRRMAGRLDAAQGPSPGSPRGRAKTAAGRRGRTCWMIWPMRRFGPGAR